MTTELYENIWLVNHIPAIRGIWGVQDLIKAFVYRGDLYMEKAKRFAKRCFYVLQDIQNIKIEIQKQIDVDIDYMGENILKLYCTKKLNNHFIFQSQICPNCGNYTCYFLLRYKKYPYKKYPRCKCDD